MKIAAAAYPPRWHATWADLAARLDRWCARAAGQGAQLAVFPEYAGIEAALIGTPDADPGAAIWRDHMALAAPDWVALHQDLARRHGLYLLTGSLCVQTPAGTVNRAYLISPTGQVGYQDKIIPTPYERDPMGLTGGTTLSLFDTRLGRIGVLICYDSEFPLLARHLVGAGADMILVPACTERAAGQTRVRQSARARAIESQCLIVHAPLIGQVPACDIVAQNTGRAALFCPPDLDLPADGILAQGDTDTPGWVVADIDPVAIAAARLQGQVGNFAHWPEQSRVTAPVQQVPLA